MRRRTTAVGVAALSLPLLGLGQRAAGAVERTGTDTVTFHNGGAEVSCTIEGGSSVTYEPQLDRSSMTASVRLASSSDAECGSLLLFMSATGTYRVDGRAGPDFFEATSVREPSAFARAGVNGVVVELDGVSRAEFDCDEGPMRCVASFVTSPK